MNKSEKAAQLMAAAKTRWEKNHATRPEIRALSPHAREMARTSFLHGFAAGIDWVLDEHPQLLFPRNAMNDR